jgi:tetratricopeptide (TPR) repeat protein
VKEGAAMSPSKPILCLLTLGLISTSVAADEDIFSVGIQALNKEEYHFAIACFEEVLTKDPTIPDAHYYLGLARQGKGDNAKATQSFNHAIKMFSDLIKLNPRQAEAYIGRGNVLLSLKDEKKAFQDYDKAIQLNPKNVEAYINRGIARKKTGNKKAIDDFDAAIGLKPNDPFSYYQRGDIYLDQQDYEKAIKDFNSAAQVDPNISDPRFFTSRGKCHLEKKEHAKAIEDLSKAISLNPKNPDVYELRARAYQGCGEFSKADKDLSKYFDLKHLRFYFGDYPFYRPILK